MLRVTALHLADFAQVREGLLFVSSGGITRIFRDTVPAPMGLHLAVIIEVPPADLPFPHEMEIRITAPSGADVFKAAGAVQLPRASAVKLDADESATLPIAMRLPGAVTEFGWHALRVKLNSVECPTSLRFKVVQPPQSARPTEPIPMNRQTRRHPPN